jgi:hypothetical protein
MTLRRGLPFWTAKKMDDTIIPTLQTIIGIPTGLNKWQHGALGLDGFIYCPPSSRTDVLKIDPFGDSFSTFGTIGVSGGEKYTGAVSHPNGKIYFIPGTARRVIELDPATNTLTEIGSDFGTTSTVRWQGGILHDDGCIYCGPRNDTQVLKIDPSTGNTTRIGTTYAGVDKFWGGVLAPNGFIYFVPSNGANQFLKLNTATSTTSLVGSSYSGSYKFLGCVIGPDDFIYAIPFNFGQVVRLNTFSDSTSNFGSSISGLGQFSGGCLGANNRIYGVPRNGSNILVIDPISRTVFTQNYGAPLGGSNMYDGLILGRNGVIYGVPRGNVNVLKLTGLKVSSSDMFTMPSPVSGLSASLYNRHQNKL